MSDLVDFLRARLDEDELWALAASAPRAGDGPPVEGGAHWTWAIGENWTPVEVEPTVEYVGEDHPEYDSDVQLITRETFPLSWSVDGATTPDELNHKVISSDGSMVRTGDGGHIVRHDPARILREVEAKRWIIECERQRVLDEGPLPERLRDSIETDVICLLALPYADHPDYLAEWRPA